VIKLLVDVAKLEADGTIKGPIVKFLSDETQRAIVERTGAGEGDLILIVADTHDVTADVLGRLRVELGARPGLAHPAVLAYVWVNRFPMYHWDEEGGPWDATHNPFSGVLPEDEALLVTSSGDPFRPSLEYANPASSGGASEVTSSAPTSSVSTPARRRHGNDMPSPGRKGSVSRMSGRPRCLLTRSEKRFSRWEGRRTPSASSNAPKRSGARSSLGSTMRTRFSHLSGPASPAAA